MSVHSQQVDIVTFAILHNFQILIFFDLWHLNGRSDKNVTVDTFACLSMCNTLTLLFLPFEILPVLTGNDPLMTFDPNKKKTLYEAGIEYPSYQIR